MQVQFAGAYYKFGQMVCRFLVLHVGGTLACQCPMDRLALRLLEFNVNNMLFGIGVLGSLMLQSVWVFQERGKAILQTSNTRQALAMFRFGLLPLHVSCALTRANQ